jgi:predicted transcriptional regulator of viral defense system
VATRNRPEIICGKVRVQFVARNNVEKIPTSDFKTPRGYLKISTPAATAFDLAGYPHHAAGLDNVATILAELAECIDGKDLVVVAALSPIAWAQRLGYLLDLVGAEEKTGKLADYIAREKPAPTPLFPSRPFRGIGQLQRWRLLVNVKVEAEV